MYILLKIMSTVLTSLKDRQDEMEKGVKRDSNHTKKRKSLWVADFK